MRLTSNRSIIESLRAAAPEWTFEHINFVAGRRGAVVEDDFYNKLERLIVQAGKRDKILLAHVQRMCSANTWGCDDVDGEHWRTSVSVNKSQFSCHQLLKKGEDGAKLE